MTARYDIAKQAQGYLAGVHKGIANELSNLGANSGHCGITPDVIKYSPEFVALKRQLDKAWHDLRAYNAVFSKEFRKEIRADRKYN